MEIRAPITPLPVYSLGILAGALSFGSTFLSSTLQQSVCSVHRESTEIIWRRADLSTFWLECLFCRELLILSSCLGTSGPWVGGETEIGLCQGFLCHVLEAGLCPYLPGGIFSTFLLSQNSRWGFLSQNSKTAPWGLFQLTCEILTLEEMPETIKSCFLHFRFCCWC